MNKYISNIDTLILGGAGLKFGYYIGCLKYLDEQNIMTNIKTYVGVSIGSLLSVLLIIGYTIDEMKYFFELFNVSKLMIEFDLDNLILNNGFDDFSKIMVVIKRLFKEKNISDNITFKQLYDITNKKFICVSSCISTEQAYYIDYINEPNMEILTALQMSMCIPIIFKPITYNNRIYCDGGLYDNYPIQLFKDNINKCIGLIVIDRNLNDDIEMDNFTSYLYNVIHSSVFNRLHNKIKKYKDNTIIIQHNENNKLATINFFLNNEEKKLMYDIGYNTCKEMLKLHELNDREEDYDFKYY